MPVFDPPPSSSGKKPRYPTEIEVTRRSKAMQRMIASINEALRNGKGVKLIVSPEDALELYALLGEITLQRNSPGGLHAAKPPTFNIMDTRDRGLIIHQADQLSADQQRGLVSWMRRRDHTQPVYALFSSTRRWRYCTKKNSKPPSSQQGRVAQWSDDLQGEFAEHPIMFPELKHRQEDVLGILLATLEALRLTEDQSNHVLSHPDVNMLLRRPPATVLLLVSEICTYVPVILRAAASSQLAPRSNRPPAPTAEA